MDLYSAAKRLARPFTFSSDTRRATLPIGAHGMIGDGATAALVRVDGEIDWLCMPRFDSPAVFASLLDPDRGGSTGVRPASETFESLQRYDPDTNVLETLIAVPDEGVLRLTDFMPWSDDPRASIHEVHRRIECVEGHVDVTIHFNPKFDYARAKTTLDISRTGVLAHSDRGEKLVAVVNADAPWQASDRGAVMRLRMSAGQRRWMVISWDASEPRHINAYRPFDHLRTTRTKWREWAGRLDYDGPWRHHVLRSALCLKMLIFAPSGAMVAAPTSSLPEWIGGTRNWDYRYAWVRDAALGIRAANLVGYSSEARDFFHFIRDSVDPLRGLNVMYSVDGGEVPDEEILAHLGGYSGSGPVRIGNGARDQFQIDTSGALVDAAHLYEHFGGTLTLRAWRKLEQVIDDVATKWREPDHGIWEPRVGKRHNVHSKLMSWLALDRGAHIARVFGSGTNSDNWSREAEAAKRDLLANGLDAKKEHFVSVYGEEGADAALLMLPIHGLLPDDHDLNRRTVDRIRAELGVGPFLYRYRHETDDGVGGEEGAFVLCGFWLAEALALQGKLEEAQEVFIAHADSSNHLGLLAEEIDPRTRSALGNFPQAFSHLGLINAALRIDLGLRLRDEGSGRSPHLIRYGVRRMSWRP